MALIKSSLLFGTGTLVSRIFGLLRDSVVAGVFGASVAMDAFIVANRIPNLLRELFAEGALGSSFTKVYSSLSEQHPDRAKKLFNDALWLLGLLSFFICALGMIYAPEIVGSLTVQSYSLEEKKSLVHQSIGLTRILFPFMGFMTLGAIAAGHLHQKSRFLVSSISPILLNISYLIGALIFARLMSNFAPDWVESYIAEKAIAGLAFGVLLGGFLQTAFLLWFSRTDVFFPKSFPWSKDLKKVFLLMMPMIIASSSGQINVLINTNFATSLETGTVTWLNYAFRVFQLPVGLFAVAISTVALPTLTKSLTISKGVCDKKSSVELLSAVELTMWCMISCLSYLLANSFSIVDLLFHHGEFSLTSTQATASLLYHYSFGVIGYGLVKVLVAFYYAVDKTKFAMYVSLFSMLTNFLANYFLVNVYGYNGLAITASIVLSCNAIFLGLGLIPYKIKLKKHKFFSGYFLIILGFILSLKLQTICSSLLKNYFSAGQFHQKISSLIELSANGFIMLTIFSTLVLISRKFSFGYAWSKNATEISHG